ncbi:hypothetical protein SR39_06225 [Methylobacterium radiotolerans]|jgi:membrane peptidoglycan carboxypeptidase|nr:hypothetical protein SR39_06225 [Methylobacterium radiotolerans]
MSIGSEEAGRAPFNRDLDHLTDEQLLSLIGQAQAVLNYRTLQRGREMQALMLRVEAEAGEIRKDAEECRQRLRRNLRGPTAKFKL